MDAARTTVLIAVATLLLVPVAAHAQSEFTSCDLAGDALIVAVSGASCDDAVAVATALADAPAA
ncbi:MAG: hypothetical protein ACRDMZ_09115, partial [Solirubrobacteraceae bacterium]